MTASQGLTQQQSAKPQRTPAPRRIARARLPRTALAAVVALNAEITAKMDDSSDDGAAVLAHTTPGRRHSWASVHTPIDWSSAASLRAELARVDARRATLLNALAALEDGVEALNNSSSDEESCCDLTQATVGGGDRTPPPPSESSDEDLVDLTQSRVRARDAPTPARDGASSSSDDDDGNHEADVRRGAPEIFVVFT